jgi:inhibitor of cysteine peptidase
MNKIQINLASFILLCCTAALADNQPYTEDHSNIIVTKQHPEFTIKLKSNPTTGYAWFLREFNKALMKPVKHHFEVPKTKLIGAPGYELWTFQMKPAAFIVPQQTEVRFIYARPWKSTDNSTPIIFKVTTQSN